MVWKQKAHPEGHARYSCRFNRRPSLHEHKINRENQADKSCQVIPMQGFALEENRCKHGKDNQRNHFLHHLELHQRERATVFHKTDAIGRHLKHVLR